MPRKSRVARLDFADRSFPVTLTDVEPTPLPNGEWARVAVTTGGICGSDLHLFKATTGPTPLLGSYVAFPMDLGHEIAGVVVEAGPDCPTEVGTRVAVDPVIACVARGIEPPCHHCAADRPSSCVNISSRRLTPGMGLGFTSGLGCGWGDEVLAHRTMLHPLPQQVDDKGSSLHEPLSIAVHGLDRAPLPDDPHAPVLVVGAGIIGLAAIAAVRARRPDAPVTVVARYPHQADAATRIGATTVVTDIETDIDALAELASTRAVKTGAGAILAGGFPYVVDAVGSASSVTQSLRTVDGRGTVLLLGAAGVSEVDLTPIFSKEVALVGSFCHAPDGHGGHSIDTALDLMASGAFPSDVVVTHEFALADLREAVTTALDRASGAIKVVLHPDDP